MDGCAGLHFEQLLGSCVGSAGFLGRCGCRTHDPACHESAAILLVVPGGSPPGAALVAGSMGPLVECRMHDFWGLWLPLGLILEQAVILELGVPSISTRLRGMLPEG